jgi:hypothetical protein
MQSYEQHLQMPPKSENPNIVKGEAGESVANMLQVMLKRNYGFSYQYVSGT